MEFIFVDNKRYDKKEDEDKKNKNKNENEKTFYDTDSYYDVNWVD